MRVRGFLAILASLLVLLSCSRKPAKPRDVIHISVPYEVDILDPHARNRLTNFAIVSHFYEPLVIADANLKIQPRLARRWENPDLLTWIFHLEPSVRFHSGKLLRARDVVHSFTRILQSSTLEMRAFIHSVASVSEIDSLTVRIRTRQPTSILLNKLNFILIVPDGASPAVLAEEPDGTGPYKLAEWKKGAWIRMARNDDYWGKPPAVREATFYLDRESGAAMDDLLSGRCQLIQCNSKKLEAALRGSGRFTLLRHPSLFMKYLAYDLALDASPYCSVQPNPFKNALVREAIHLAIDRQRLVDRLPIYAVPATQPVPPFIFGFNPGIPAPVHDLERAQMLLREAGLAHGFGVTLHVRKLFAEAAHIVLEQLARIGLRVEVKALADPEFLEFAERHHPTFFISRLGCPTGDASDILDNGLHSSDPARNLGLFNFGRYSNTEVDRRIEESAGVYEILQRRQLLQEVMARAMADLAWIPLYIDEDVYAVDRSFYWQPRNDSFILAAEISPRS